MEFGSSEGLAALALEDITLVEGVASSVWTKVLVASESFRMAWLAMVWEEKREASKSGEELDAA
jgi:hypothetical protein